MAGKRCTKVLIVGAGPAGYSAAIYAARAGLQPVILTGMQPGGQLTVTTDVENYPGFAEAIQGPWLMEQMAQQSKHMDAEIVADLVTRVDFSRRPFLISSDSGEDFLADAVIIATGAQARWLGIPSEEAFRGGGVSACATCDGFFFRERHVAVIGGGNTAVEEALYLTHHASHVTIVHRRDRFRAEWILQEKLFVHPKISVIWNHTVEEITGVLNPACVNGLRLRHVDTGSMTTIDVNGVFVAIGHTPATAIFKGQIETDVDGYIITKSGTTETSVPGVFAAGDVQDKIYRQAVTAAGTGCMAALEAEKFLANVPLRVSEIADVAGLAPASIAQPSIVSQGRPLGI